MDADQNGACHIEINGGDASLHYGQDAQAGVGHLGRPATPNPSNGFTRHRVLFTIVATRSLLQRLCRRACSPRSPEDHWKCAPNTRWAGGHSS